MFVTYIYPKERIMYNVFLKYIFLYILIFITDSNNCSAQEWTPHRIDTTLSKQVIQLRREGKILEALKISQEALKQALMLQYNEGIKAAYYTNANILIVLGRCKESIEYLDELAKYLSNSGEDIRLMRMYADYGRNYQQLGFYKQAAKSFKEARKIAKRKWTDDTPKVSELIYLYSSEALLYEEMGDYDSFLEVIQLGYAVRPTPFLAARLLKYYTVYKPNKDSCNYLHILRR